MPGILTMVKTQGEDVEFESSGEQLYAQICAACHGVDREGNVGNNVPSLAGVETRLKRPDVPALLQNGKGVMPSVAFLTDGQKAGLIDYIFGVAPSDTQRGDEVPIGSHGAMGRRACSRRRGAPAASGRGRACTGRHRSGTTLKALPGWLGACG